MLLCVFITIPGSRLHGLSQFCYNEGAVHFAADRPDFEWSVVERTILARKRTECTLRLLQDLYQSHR